MKQKILRLAALCMIFSALCAGALFQYITADQNNMKNAVLVMATLH